MARRRPVETAAPVTPPEEVRSAQPGTSRLVALGPDWLPLALLVGDAVIVAASVLAAYWYYVNLDPLRRAAGAALPFGPYLAAIPLVITIYLFSLAINHQYQSWRGRTLMDLVLGLYSGIGLAAVLILAAIAFVNLGVDYSSLTIKYAVLLSAGLMPI